MKYFLTATLILISITRASGQTSGKHPNDVVWRLAWEPETLIPLLTFDNQTPTIQNEIWESLNRLDPRSHELIPCLASLPVISSDHLVYRYILDKRARFSDGKPVRAEDVIFTFKAAIDPLVRAASRFYFTCIDSIHVEGADSSTLAFHLNNAVFNSDAFLGTAVDILPKHVYDPTGLTDRMSWSGLREEHSPNTTLVEFATWMDSVQKLKTSEYNVGSGPYTLAHWEPYRAIALARSEHYWADGLPGFEAYPDSIIYKVVTDEEDAKRALISGDIDLINSFSRSFYREIKQAYPSIRTASVERNFYSFLDWNNSIPLFADKRVRQALTLAIDRKAIIHNVLDDVGIPVGGPVTPSQGIFDPTVPVLPFDPQKAKILLKEAGWSDSDGDGILDKKIGNKRMSFAFEFIISSGSEYQAQALKLVCKDLKRVGIKATVKEIDWSVMLQRKREGNFEASYGGWMGDPREDDLFGLWHSSMAAPRGANTSRYRSAIADSLLTAIRTEFDKGKRYALSAKLQQVIADDQPYGFLFTSPALLAFQDRFDNVEFFSAAPYVDPRYWVAKGSGIKALKH
jgi:peptide/nickel transport system substrate-binding protein